MTNVAIKICAFNEEEVLFTLAVNHHGLLLALNLFEKLPYNAGDSLCCSVADFIIQNNYLDPISVSALS